MGFRHVCVCLSCRRVHSKKKGKKKKKKLWAFWREMDRVIAHSYTAHTLEKGKRKSIKSIPHTSGRINMVRIEQQQQQLRWIGKNGKRNGTFSSTCTGTKQKYPSEFVMLKAFFFSFWAKILKDSIMGFNGGTCFINRFLDPLVIHYIRQDRYNNQRGDPSWFIFLVFDLFFAWEKRKR